MTTSGSRPTQASARTGSSARSLVAANAGTLVLAVVFGWDLGWLMWPYWIQSVVIGWYARTRMLSLRDFSTEGFTSNGKPVPETEAAKRSTANFFTFHYGFFHAGYLVFLLSEHAVGTPLQMLVLAACGLPFILSQRETYAAQHAADLRGRPNLGSLMFLPYLRVLPMHLGVIFAGAFDGGTSALILFVALKTLGDLGLDRADRAIAEKGAREAAARG
ncbi:MAG: DUF6498-containing protein [Rhodocyclaceae bacterium]